jgi:LAS superfamily LD-carboxypeptidase LdcB
MKPEELTGFETTHLAFSSYLNCYLHAQALEAIEELAIRAARAGFKFYIVSGFRNFSKQLSIWNKKFKGELPLYNRAGSELITGNDLSEKERVHTILNWTALPGASRHHWGTDFDFIDKSNEAVTYQLIPSEYTQGGPAHSLYCWLLQVAPKLGFFFPYPSASTGIAWEPWHLSYAPVSKTCLKALTIDLLSTVIASNEVLGEHTIIEHLDTLFYRYIKIAEL